MEPWKTVCIYVSVYVILREFRPIDPFTIKYLTLVSENYTVQLIREEVYPVGTYVSLFLVAVIFLVTDYLRYKPIMIMNGLSGIISYSLLLGSPSIFILQVGQVFQMFFRAAEIAYYTYIFAKIEDKEQYQIANSRVRTSVMIGKFSCGVLAQVLITSNIVGYTFLLYLSIFGMVLTTMWSFIMPPVQNSLYFYKEKELPVVNSIVVDNQEIVQTKISEPMTNGDIDKTTIKVYEKEFTKSSICLDVIPKLWADFKVAYEDTNVFKWSVWWSLSLCGYVLVAQYIQLQWQEIVSNDKNARLMNGAVESLATIFSAAAAYAMGAVNGDWDKYGELIMAMVSFGLGIMCYFLAITESLTLSYVYYIIFCCVYQTMLTISSAEVAKFLKRDCYALVFGFNKFISYILITMFTLFVVEDTFFSLDIRQQFLIYGIYFMVLGGLFTLMTVISVSQIRNSFNSLKKIVSPE